MLCVLHAVNRFEYLRKRGVEQLAKESKRGPPKGAPRLRPSYVPTPFQSFSYSIFGTSARRSSRNNAEFEELLETACIQVKPEVYIASVWMATIISVVFGVLMALAFMAVTVWTDSFIMDILARNDIVGVISQGIIYFLLIVALPLITYNIMYSIPKFKVSVRRINIESNLPYAANFVAAMAAAHATPTKIFRSLAMQESVYGEIARDALRIYKDIELLGMDIITSIKRAVRRAPSMKYRDFLQGIASTLQSGGDLKSYFVNKAREYMREHEALQKEFLETLAFMAESYVVVAVAMPIFLMVILIIMYWVSSGMNIGESLLLLIVFVMLPAIHFGYIVTVNMMTPEV